jgi:hypothetical protein
MGDSPKFLPLAHADCQLMCKTRWLPLRAMFFGNAFNCHHRLIYGRKSTHDYCFHSHFLSSLKDDVHEYETHSILSLLLMLIANGDNGHLYGRTCCDNQPLLLGQSKPAVSRRQRSNHMTQTTKIALLL